jgi:hypothetical protein
LIPNSEAFAAYGGFPASAHFPAAGVFREGAENRACGGRAPLSTSEFGFKPLGNPPDKHGSNRWLFGHAADSIWTPAR